MKKRSIQLLAGIMVFMGLMGNQEVVAQTQTGPGGVGDASTLAVWLDASTLSLNNGDPVATWTDRSGNGNDFAQSVTTYRPIFNGVGTMNSKPSVQFDGSNDFLEIGAVNSLGTDVLSYFIVHRNQSSLPITSGRFGVPIATRSTLNNTEWFLQLKRENSGLVRVERYARQSPSAFSIALSDLTNAEALSPIIVNGIWRGDNNIYGQVNGFKTGTKTGAVSSGFDHVATFLGGSKDLSGVPVRCFTGEIAEVVVFANEINSAQEKIIYNHLSAKYGISLGGGVLYAHNAAHPNDVAGIGRDNVTNQHLAAKGYGYYRSFSGFIRRWRLFVVGQ
jgi:hypothetical protein